MTADISELIPCPFLYAKGRHCSGHIIGVTAFKADLHWTLQKDGRWQFRADEPRSHYHLTCSEKGTHATNFGRTDSDSMKFYYQDLPAALRKVISGDPLS